MVGDGAKRVAQTERRIAATSARMTYSVEGRQAEPVIGCASRPSGFAHPTNQGKVSPIFELIEGQAHLLLADPDRVAMTYDVGGRDHEREAFRQTDRILYLNPRTI